MALSYDFVARRLLEVSGGEDGAPDTLPPSGCDMPHQQCRGLMCAFKFVLLTSTAPFGTNFGISGFWVPKSPQILLLFRSSSCGVAACRLLLNLLDRFAKIRVLSFHIFPLFLSSRSDTASVKQRILLSRISLWAIQRQATEFRLALVINVASLSFLVIKRAFPQR